MLRRPVFAISALTVISFASGVFSAGEKALPADEQARILERHPGADANNDGVLSPEEIRAATSIPRGPADMPPGGPLSILIPVDPAEILQSNPQADADGDGRLSGPERKAFMDTQRVALEKELLAAHPELDANGDGALGPDEMRGARRQMEEFISAKVLAAHPEADTDGDGKLNRDEIRAFQMSRGAGFGGSPAAHVGWMLANFQKVDANGDGQLTVEELENFQREVNPRPESVAKQSRERTREGPAEPREPRKNREPRKARKVHPEPAP